MTKRRWWSSLVALVAVAVVFVLWEHIEARRRISDPKALAAEEDEVYAAVVRHVYLPNKKNPAVTHLVFNRTLDTYLCPGMDRQTCLNGVRQRLKEAAGGSIRRETIDNFIEQSQISGSLPQYLPHRVAKDLR